MSDKMTIYWDLDPSVINDPDIAMRVSGEIAQLGHKVGLLHLTDPHPELCADSMAILHALQGSGVEILLTAKPSVFNSQKFEALCGTGLSGLLLSVDTHHCLKLHAEDITRQSIRTGISFDLSTEDAEELPRILSACREHGIREVHFPIARITADHPDVFCPDPDYLIGLRSNIKMFVRENDFLVSVQDPFVRKAFGLGERAHCCLAAKEIIFINGGYDVLPCPAIPVPLGNLYRKPLAEVLSSEKMQRMRKMLSAPPSECLECAEVKACSGGCRGRSFSFHGIFEKKDPACGF